MQTDIEVGCIVIGVPKEQNSCPNDHHGLGFEVDNSLVGKMRRVYAMQIDPESGCVPMDLEPDAAVEWCIGCFRRVKTGKIPNPEETILEPA